MQGDTVTLDDTKEYTIEQNSKKPPKRLKKKRSETASGDLPDHVVATKAQVAEHFQKNVRTIKRWMKKGHASVVQRV